MDYQLISRLIRFPGYLLRNSHPYIYLIITASLFTGAAWAEEKIIVWDRTYERPSMLEVLQLALEKSGDNKPYQLIRSVKMEQGRVMRELQKDGHVDVAAFAPTTDREEKAIAVRIPVSKGLLGYRVCLIRAGDEDKFKNIHSISDWIKSGLLLGQGTHWPDTPILESNGLAVVKSVRYAPLFNMLKKKRFDCFPRSVNEVLAELKKPENINLVLEQHLLFQYRLPTFFFVNKHKPLLAQRIERGLNIAIKDGSFERLFKLHHMDTLQEVNLKQRHMIKLNNPYLSDETQQTIKRSELWLDPVN